MFELNLSLLARAHKALRQRGNIFWVVGGAASGKSTVCRAIAAETCTQLIDLDDRVFGTFQERFRPGRHPASTAWFSAPNPLEFMLSLPWVEFDALYRAANAEYLDLLVDDLAHGDDGRPLLLDGGISHPSVLVRVLPASTTACLATSAEESQRQWETSADRSSMREWIASLPDPGEIWRRFLLYNRCMSDTIIRESRQAGIQIFWREESTSVNDLARSVAEHLNLAA